MAWNLKRGAISALLVAHLAALGIWNLPGCAIRDRLGGWAAYYMMPTGQWQCWGMFAPEPPRNTFELEAVVLDGHGLVRRFAFPTLGDKTVGETFWHFRQAKYASVLGAKESKAHREFAARYAIRKLGLEEGDFPVDLQLLYRMTPSSPPGAPADAAPALPWESTLENYNFPNLAETRP